MFKKIISMTLTILMIVSCIQITFAAELPNISISNARGNVGEKVFVDISIANNSGFDAFAIGIMYDNKYLEPVDIVTNTDLGGMDGSNLNNMDEHRNPMISYTFISADEISVSGKVATIEFKIVGTPDGGKTPLRIVKYQNNSMLANNSAEVSVATTNGEVTVGGGEEPILVTGVSLNKTETSIKKDESETLTATITPANATNKGVTWESENPEIAIVNNGEVTAKKVGSTKIIVTTADGGKKAECLVTVIENVISVTGVSLNKTAANIQNGSTETLVATIMPTNATNKGVTWKSENTEIAVVNNGEVTAKKVGDTKIVVTTIDGEKKAECHITVTRKPGGGGGGGTIAGPKVSMPTSNLTSGEVVAGTAVELACTTGESKIYYTLDGSKPTKKSELYKEPIVIDKDTVVKAIGTRVGMSDSDILTVQYTIKKDDKPTDMRFTDLGGYEWAEKQINSLADKGIIKGVSETLFAPQDNITRADYTILLVRMLGVNADFTDNFDDIPEDAYYYKEIGVAKKLGIALGVGENKFDPKATVTREDLFVLAYRTLLDQKITLTSATKDEISAFTDAGDVSDYAKLAIATLVKNGLVEGFENKIKPKDFATRAETAVFIFRLDELIANK